MGNKFDEALTFVGGFGPFQYCVSFCSLLIHAYCGWPSVISVFVSLEVPFQCVERRMENGSLDGDNTSLMTSSGKLDGLDQYDSKCEQDCLKYEYMDSPASIISTFDLACGTGRTLISLANSSFWVSFLISCFIVGPLSDKFGRRRIFLPAACIYFVVTMALAFVQNIYQFISLRFMCGLFHYPVITLPYIISMEMIAPSKRASVGMATTTSFCMGICLCPVVALFFKNSWRNQIVAMAATQLPLLVFACFKLSESGRWLLQKGKTCSLERQLLKTAKRNGKSVTLTDITAFLHSESSIEGSVEKPPKTSPEEDEADEYRVTDKLLGDSKEDPLSQSPKPTFVDLFRTFRSTLLCVTNAVVWVAVSMIYYGLTFGVDILPGNVYLNSIFMALVELPAVFSIVAIDKFGRRPTLITLFVIASVACLLLPVANQYLPHARLVRHANKSEHCSNIFSINFPTNLIPHICIQSTE